MNLRKDHYQRRTENHFREADLTDVLNPVGTTLYLRNATVLAVADDESGTVARLPSHNSLRTTSTLLPRNPHSLVDAGEVSNKTHLHSTAVRRPMTKSLKTFNNGSLGSRIDEERSEMR